MVPEMNERSGVSSLVLSHLFNQQKMANIVSAPPQSVASVRFKVW